ncbi:hypothetical protein POF51_26395 [Brevibacillus sp. AG]|uniref:hypothetical protein n=1 Tax=Brevibacillus sp. AG TaxID=3020891 RepID=UPI0023305230|nr:hypothetical protein [Brevibacillus sp. AG]MDC0764254.1 hypothetical protein [Brevibacillus sp. AG]
MKKLIYTAIAGCLLFVPSAEAAVTDTSTTSNFTVTVVEETLGLNIAGETNLGEVIQDTIKNSNGNQSVEFNNISFTNSGNTKGVLYGQVLTPKRTTFGQNSEEISFVGLKSRAGRGGSVDVLYQYSVNPIPTEVKLANMMESFDTDLDKTHVGPGETLGNIQVLLFEFNDRVPLGELTLPIQWVMKSS